MFRRDLVEILKQRSLSAHELAELLQVPVKEIHEDLAHLQRSLKHLPYRLEVEPASCKKCGFCFAKDRLTKPGKCPVCKQTWIAEPRIHIVDR
jgi:predicted Zn-ribbon and HTH transcriptional regulator